MQITDPARKIIIETMIKEGLDPIEYFLYLSVPDKHSEGFGFGFCKEVQIGKNYEFENLRVVVDFSIDVDNLIIDYYKEDDKMGIIFRNGE